MWRISTQRVSSVGLFTAYRKAAKTAPARPRLRPTGAAVAMIAALEEEVLEPEAVPVLELVLEPLDAVEVRVTALVLLRAVLVELLLTAALLEPRGMGTVTMLEAPLTTGTLTTGTLDRPAGIEAAGD